MYPQRELKHLDACKVALQQEIARHRTECVVAAQSVLKPLDVLDRFLAAWHSLSPLVIAAVVPLGFLLRRTVSSRRSGLGLLLRWGPLLLKTVGRVRSAIAHRQTPLPQETGH